jgi:uncharacterized cupin superfamily protein
MPKIDLTRLRPRSGSRYPPPFDAPCANKSRQRLGDAAGLSQFGVNLLVLQPGAWSTQRHWHGAEDEFVWVLGGEVTLVSEMVEEVLRAGDCAGFKAGVPDGHHLINRSEHEARVLEIGTRVGDFDPVQYPDIDLVADRHGYLHRDGTRYPDPQTARSR